ncbi:MAG: DNA polymerase III subunit gamma/tau [Bdellovibrionales bacterium]|nr:DNA polymerase III subunit gamma/tau [Bdellovibrionales bacterium]
MSYLAIARKWRPTEFEDLVGQTHVVQTLKNAIAHNRVSHAYLFSGPRGIGKTSVARIFARALRCPNNEMPESQMIAEGRSLDVVEIDGASNNGVEAVREIRENVAYGASTGTYKIYIIDEVHMLSLSAFNALLKTLEEPPPHVVFIFATTEVQKIPMTILSRCQRFEFRRLTSIQIIERLKVILEKESLSISEDGLRVIAAHSDGALRDALSLLDQVLSCYSSAPESQLGEKEVVEALGISSSSASRALLGCILKSDLPDAFKLIEETYFGGVDLKNFCERCLEEIRMLYLMALGAEQKKPLTAADLDISSTHFSELEDLSAQASLLQLERMAQIFSQVLSQLSWASLPRFVLEMAVARMAKLDGLSKIERLWQQAPTVQVAAPSPTAKVATPPVSAPTPAPAYAPAPLTPSQPNWKSFVDALMKRRPLLGALLSHANFKIDDKGQKKKVVVSFPEESFYEKQAKETKNWDDISRAIQDHFGQDTEITLSNVTNDTHQSLETTRQIETEGLRKKALEHPSVLQAKEILGGEIVDVKIDN